MAAVSRPRPGTSRTSNPEHQQLAELARHAEEAAAAVELPPRVSFQAQRRRIREALSRDGVGGEINNLTTVLLAVGRVSSRAGEARPPDRDSRSYRVPEFVPVKGQPTAPWLTGS